MTHFLVGPRHPTITEQDQVDGKELNCYNHIHNNERRNSYAVSDIKTEGWMKFRAYCFLGTVFLITYHSHPRKHDHLHRQLKIWENHHWWWPPERNGFWVTHIGPLELGVKVNNRTFIIWGQGKSWITQGFILFVQGVGEREMLQIFNEYTA